MKYWLLKSEPDVFSIEDLEAKAPRGEPWDGVRNYQARNFMMQMEVGDLAFFYHSNAKPSGIAGICKIAKAATPDKSAWDRSSEYFDPKSTPESPRWYAVEVAHVKTFPAVLSLEMLKACDALKDSPLVRKGNRLSVFPVSKDEWDGVLDTTRMENPAEK